MNDALQRGFEELVKKARRDVWFIAAIATPLFFIVVGGLMALFYWLVGRLLPGSSFVLRWTLILGITLIYVVIGWRYTRAKPSELAAGVRCNPLLEVDPSPFTVLLYPEAPMFDLVSGSLSAVFLFPFFLVAEITTGGVGRPTHETLRLAFTLLTTQERLSAADISKLSADSNTTQEALRLLRRLRFVRLVRDGEDTALLRTLRAKEFLRSAD